jgi:hypothetical protein
MARAVADFAMDCRIVSIDPHPRASIEALGVELNRSVLEDAPSHLFDDLAAGDILFVDSSHIAMPGGDVDRLFNDILPRLPRDVLVHVHDIFLPGRYPKQWQWRGYNEQLVVAALIHGSGYEILFSSQYIRQHAENLSVPAFIDRLPVPQTAIETGLWLKKSCVPLS